MLPVSGETVTQAALSDTVQLLALLFVFDTLID
jgi:hypothetical protein